MHRTPIGYISYTKTNRDDIFLESNTKIRHTVLFGKSGVGKTTLLRNMILSDIWNNAGTTVIDPHGQLIDELLEQIRNHARMTLFFCNPLIRTEPFLSTFSRRLTQSINRWSFRRL
jgi:DNA helicase HerA-like ATPase